MKLLRLAATFVLAVSLASCTQDGALTENDVDNPDLTMNSEGLSMTQSYATSKGAIKWLPDDFCAVFDAFGDFHLTPCKNQFATFSQNGNAMVMTKASGVPNPTGKMVRWDAYNPPPIMLEAFGLEEPPAPCVLLDTEGELTLFTLKWWNTVSASGEASFHCVYSKQWEFEWPS